MENRKATDVIIELEAKIDYLLALIKTQDSNIKTISNKLNSVMTMLEKTSIKTPVYIEQGDKPKNPSFIPINEESSIKVISEPQGARRGSRAEASLPNNNVFIISSPAVNETPEIIIPKQEESKSDFKNINTISVFQRVVSDGNKSIFLAEVVVNSLKTNAEVFKGKTSANGKWAANLEPGDYKVIVSKRDNISKEKKVFEQIIKIDGKTSVLELPNLVIN